MRITEAAQRLGTSPRMLRYRETLGLLPALAGVGAGEAGREGRPAGQQAGSRAGRSAGQQAGRPAGPAAGGAAGHRAGREAGGRARRGPGHRQFRDQDVAAVALALDLERRLDISPAALAFGLRVLAEPGVRAQVAELGRRIGRIPPPPGSALDFEKERALRLLSMGQRPGQPAPPPVPRTPARLPARRPSGPPTPSPSP
jgi:MerR family transcriptional regulator, copper efflux regulator